eukprot:scaffold435_cov275-Chaetoceros_neogracile.AAC.44
MNRSRSSTTSLFLVFFFISSCDGFQQGNRPKQSTFATQASTKGNKPIKGIRDELTSITSKATMSAVCEDDIDICSFEDEDLKKEDCGSENICSESSTIKMITTFDTVNFVTDENSKAVPSASPQNTAKKLMKEGMSLYVHFLKTHSLLTKTLTSGLVGIVGDVMAQLFEHRMSGGTKFFVDIRRIFGIFFECAFLSAPLMHYAYDFLEYLVPIHGIDSDGEQHVAQDQAGSQKRNVESLKRWGAAIFHVLSDIFLLGPFYVLFIMTSTSIFEGRIWSLRTDLLSNFLSTFKTSVVVSLGFMPFQVSAFRVLPTQFRLLYINMQDIIWSAAVSFAAHKSRH